MSWWRDRQLLKQARELTVSARKFVRIQRDLLDPDRVQELDATIRELAGSVRTRDMGAMATHRDRLEKLLDKSVPHHSYASLRENVEVLLVAVIVAMGVRTFFLQPFKIPTGSMQPTLYGIYPSETVIPYDGGRQPTLPEKVLGIALLGRIYEPGGYRTRGDHIFVDKITYHFCRPQRGDVVVFSTDDIAQMSPESRGKFYIKRLIGLGGDRIRIEPPHVVVNGKVLDGRPAFKRIYSQRDGYTGYQTYTMASVAMRQPARYPSEREPDYEVPRDELYVLGDNSLHSYDARYWGGFPRTALVGRAIMVYWPFSRRFGLIE